MSPHIDHDPARLRDVRARLSGALVCCLVIALAGCASKPPKPVKTRLVVTAKADVNPDADGRASPIVVRVYQLKEDAAFRDAEYFAIVDREQATLAASLVSRKELTLAPGDQQTLDFPVSADARYIAVAAGYRDIRNADWRVVKGAPKKGIKGLVKTDSISVTLEKARALLDISD
jgi:type VI secretion system protein VasD